VKQADLIWMNGTFVPWDEAKVHVLTHGLHYGTGVFEGVRCYDTESNGPAVFRHQEHLDRLYRSAGLYYMDIPYEREQLRQATLELIARNGMRSCYIRPLVYRGYGQMGLFPLEAPVDVTIAVWEWGSYLGDEGKQNGVRAKVSSWRRISPDSLIPQAKACGQYLNSVLAKIESHKAGYEEGILLDDRGKVCEGTGENLFLIRDGVIATPPLTASILDGINRRAAIEIARDLGYEVVEKDLDRSDLYLSDEIFMTGTAAELTPDPRGRRPPDRHRRARRDHPRGAVGLRGRPARARRALPALARPGAGAGDHLMTPRRALRRHAARRHGGAGITLTADEKLRVVHRSTSSAWTSSRRGFPSSNPKEESSSALLAGETLRTRRSPRSA
jgi:branched-chain amino acid aminotransferase